MDPSKEGELAWRQRQSKWKEEDLAPPWLGKDNTKLDGHSVPVNMSKGLLANAKNVRIGAPTDFDMIPIEEFGMSMVIGMGYDASKPDPRRPAAVYQPPKRKYFQAGIGAEEEMLLPHEKAEAAARLAGDEHVGARGIDPDAEAFDSSDSGESSDDEE